MKEEIVDLFYQERRFLDGAYKNITQELDLKDALVSVFAEGEESIKQLYQNAGLEGAEIVNPEIYEKMGASHFQSYLDLVVEDKTLRVDVWTFEKDNRQDYEILLAGITRALMLFRGGIFDVKSFFLDKNGEKEELSISDYEMTNLVERWLEDDEDFQFFRKSSRPYVKGYFKKPDLLGMGASMIAGIRDAVNEYAFEQNREGSFMLEIQPYEKQMRRAFGDIVDGDDSISTTTKIIKNFKMNSEKHIILGTGERYDVTLKIKYSHLKDKEVKEDPLIIISAMIWAPQIEAAGYRRSIVMSLVQYIELWSEIASPLGYECEFSEQTHKF